jgi:hypothetical protein
VLALGACGDWSKDAMTATETVDRMTKEERSLLLYLETRAVDHGGYVCGANMNPADFDTARGWASAGFIRFSRLLSDLKPEPHRFPVTHAVELTGESAACAAVERRRRSVRSQRDAVKESLAHFEALHTADAEVPR